MLATTKSMQQQQRQLQRHRQQQLKPQQQQVKLQLARSKRCMHLHRQLNLQLQQQYYGIAMIVVVFGLFLTTIIRVSGQIEGYTAGIDYPAYDTVPKGLSFKCQGRTPGYYADIESRCQVWHWCLHSGHQYSFLCPNGTVFNQAVRVCDWWSNVNCPASEQLYENNEELYKPMEQNRLNDI